VGVRKASPHLRIPETNCKEKGEGKIRTKETPERLQQSTEETSNAKRFRGLPRGFPKKKKTRVWKKEKGAKKSNAVRDDCS